MGRAKEAGWLFGVRIRGGWLEKSPGSPLLVNSYVEALQIGRRWAGCRPARRWWQARCFGRYQII